jgi:hypothetical protein
MSDPRAGGLQAVRSSLRTLVYCCAASAVIELGTRGAFTFFLGRLRSGAWADYGLFAVGSFAIAKLGLAVDAASDVPRYRQLRAKFLAEAGRFEEALADCDAALAAGPSDSVALLRFTVLAAVGREGEVRAPLDELISFHDPRRLPPDARRRPLPRRWRRARQPPPHGPPSRP